MKINYFDRNFNIGGKDFFDRATYYNSEGQMFFGSNNGYISFTPTAITSSYSKNQVNFTHLEIFNKEVTFHTHPEVIKTNIEVATEIVLKHEQSVISLTFTALSFLSPEKNQYAYFLDGFDKDWQYVGNSRKATYTNLDPGEYTFFVKASNNETFWSEPTQITVIIIPPWWMTWWFRILTALCVFGTIALVFYIRFKRIKKINRVLEAKVAQRTESLNESNIILQNQKEEIQTQKELLEEQNDALQESNNTKDRFFSIIAHDLKNPLNALIGFSELLSNSFSSLPDKKKKYFVEIISRSSKNLLELLNNLLEWSRSQSGRISYEPQLTTASSIINENVLLLKQHAAKKKIRISFVPENNVEMYIDRNMFNTIVRNLLSNAIKFTPHGGLISITTEENTEFISISISDTGVGMSKEKIDDLFKIDKNTSTKGTDSEQGTGLGLILCKEFIEKHQGKITVNSIENKGTTFSIYVPRKG